MKVTRRRLAALLAAAPAAARAQAPGAPAPAGELAAARERTKRALEQAAKIKVPMATEPAFTFKT
jgi:hypothetical protein